MTESLRGIPCGDCGSSDPQWATLNRGLLLCKECCCIHRSLGPQCSRVKSLKGSQWHPNLKKMLLTLASGSANHVWEHTLLDPSKADSHQPHVRKPMPSDHLETIKRKFINSKHFLYQFVLRQKPETFEERNQELHSTVRTSDLGTTLRLLTSGADPNFFHPEKGTRPIHVAARTGQSLQVELLFLHGAQTDAPDYLGQSAVEHAMAAGFKELAQRITELRYNLTDQLSFFACNKMPDHSSSKHIVIPAYTAKSIMQEYSVRNLLPHVLEQFVADLYDEVDRRQLEKDMIAVTSGPEVLKLSIAFLPVHSNFSSVRNQTRQKFARLTDDELGSLITLVLIESKRRHCNDSTGIGIDKDIFIHDDIRNGGGSSMGNCRVSSLKTGSIPVPLAPAPSQILEDDDYPLYDSVASDEDLILTEQQTILAQQRSTMEETALSSSNLKPMSSCDITNGREGALATKLCESEAKIQELEECNQNMKMEIMVLQKMVSSIINENLELKINAMLQLSNSNHHTSFPNLVNGHNGSSGRALGSELQVCKSKPPRPASMCEPRGEKLEAQGLPVRPNTTEVYLRKKQFEFGEANKLVQETTRVVVELIKVIIQFANKNELEGIKLASDKIYEHSHEMATNLLLRETRQEVKESLEAMLLQVLRMKFEILQLIELNPPKAILRHPAPNKGSASAAPSSSPQLVKKVRQICFAVGASIKQLVSTVHSS